MPPWPSRSWGCGGWSIGWKATGSNNSRPSMVGALPGPTKARRLARPRAGSVPGCVWGPARRRAVSGRLGVVRGPLTATAEALVGGELSVAHARVLAMAPRSCPTRSRPRPNRCWWRRPAAWIRRGCGGSWGICVWSPTRGRRPATRGAAGAAGVWLAPRWRGWSRSMGCWSPRLVRVCCRPWSRWPAQPMLRTAAAVASVGLMPWRSWPAGGWRGAAPPDRWGPAPADRDRGPGQPPGPPGSLGGEVGGAGPLGPEAGQRLACDSSATRVLVTRQASGDHGHVDHGHHDGSHGKEPMATRLRAAMALLPAVLGGAPTQPLEVGRASRVVQSAQRTALAVRDRGCVFPGCMRPLAWCEAHHLRHWLHGGPTDLANLALVCRAHHRAVHEGGWQLVRQPDGRLTATPPHRPHRRHPTAA